ncbi:hypothetical protein D9613_012230 [Agrocybe pediades]|uniref:Uncharacterized protein n=1 Tax=Agrocybe pediades TaxID=84607 RepID=A0A8H4QEJ8_9AGAR|nr:hypothetical protein D9613_012230 [Agrocybe pediades]
MPGTVKCRITGKDYWFQCVPETEGERVRFIGIPYISFPTFTVDDGEFHYTKEFPKPDPGNILNFKGEIGGGVFRVSMLSDEYVFQAKLDEDIMKYKKHFDGIGKWDSYDADPQEVVAAVSYAE